MAHPVDIHVGKRLRLRRSMLGMSQEALGDAIGVTFQQIQKYERGINRIGSSRLYEFAKVMNVPVSFFFEEFTKPVEAAEAYGFAEDEAPAFEQDKLNSKETMALVRAYYEIEDPAVRKKVLGLIKALSPAKVDSN